MRGTIEIYGFVAENKEKHISKKIVGDYRQAVAICKSIRRNTNFYYMTVAYEKGDYTDYSIQTNLSTTAMFGPKKKSYSKQVMFWEDGNITTRLSAMRISAHADKKNRFATFEF